MGDPAGGSWAAGRSVDLGRRDVGRLQTFGALRHFEFDSSAFIQGAISLRLNRREVNEDVLSVFTLDEAIALGRVDPLHSTFNFHLPLFLLQVKKEPRSTWPPPDEKRGCTLTQASPCIVERKTRVKCPSIIQHGVGRHL